MKRYTRYFHQDNHGNITDCQMIDSDMGDYVEFTDVQALCREVLPFISSFYENELAVRDKLKAIIEAKP